MTELATPPVPTLKAGASIAAIIPTGIEDAYRLSTAVHKSGLAPASFKSAEAIMIAILQGLEVGLAPMQALHSIAVINGRPTLWGDGLIAVVRQSSACGYIKEWVDGDGDSRAAYCETQRKGEPAPNVRFFSVAHAKKAGLWNKQGPWAQYPDRMLQMRARALCLRDTYADILKGIQVREEIEDYPMRDITPQGAQPGVSGVMSRLGAGTERGAVHSIIAHVDASIDGLPEGDGANIPPDGGDVFDGGIIESDPPREDPAGVTYDLDRLRAYGKALMRCSSAEALSAGHLAFFPPDEDAPDKSDEETPWGKIYKLHMWRIVKDESADKVLAGIERIIGGL